MTMGVACTQRRRLKMATWVFTGLTVNPHWVQYRTTWLTCSCACCCASMWLLKILNVAVSSAYRRFRTLGSVIMQVEQEQSYNRVLKHPSVNWMCSRVDERWLTQNFRWCKQWWKSIEVKCSDYALMPDLVNGLIEVQGDQNGGFPVVIYSGDGVGKVCDQMRCGVVGSEAKLVCVEDVECSGMISQLSMNYTFKSLAEVAQEGYWLIVRQWCGDIPCLSNGWTLAIRKLL